MFIPRISDETYKFLGSAAEAHMNMIGSGVVVFMSKIFSMISAMSSVAHLARLHVRLFNLPNL